MSDPLDWLDEVAEGRQRRGLSRHLVARGPASPGRIDESGRALLNFASNDYLGLAADPRLAEAAHEAAQKYGWGAGASPLVAGWREPHERLAEDLARFERAEAVALFPTGYAANLGTLAALVGPGDAVYLDRLNHSCLVAGARLSGATLRVYPHADAPHLAEVMARDEGRFRRSLIATDGVFSMDGDLAPVDSLADIAEKHAAMLLVDEAHGTGVVGPDGRGASSARGAADRVHARVGTLSKALGSIGGFVAGTRRLVEHLVNHAPTLVYSTALPPAAVAAAGEALRIALDETWRREHVGKLGASLSARLRESGWEVPAIEAPIVPLIQGDADRATALSTRLRDLGMLAPAIRPPTVPRGTARLRISLSAAHTTEDLDALIAALADC